MARARDIQIGRIPANLSATLDARVNARVDLGLLNAIYVFATPVLGSQASASLIGIYGAHSTSLNALVTGSLSLPPPIGPIPFSRFDPISDSITGFGDLIPQFALRWNAGWPALVLRSDSSFPSAACRAISTSRAMVNLQPRTGPPAGMPG